MNKVGDKAVQKAPPATQEEQAIIRTRILTQVFTSKGEPPLRRLATAWVQFGRALGGAASDRAAKHQALLLELANIEYHARRHGAICDVNHREQAELAQQHAALEAILDSAAAATDEARTGLAQARVKRTEEEEYELLRHELMKLPGRDTTAAEAEAVTADIAALQADIERADATLELRRKQFAAFLHCLDELQAALFADKAGEDGEAGEAPPPPPPAAAGGATAMEA